MVDVVQRGMTRLALHAPGRADRPEDVGGGRALILGGRGSRSACYPAPGQGVLLADPRLVAEPDLYGFSADSLAVDPGAHAVLMLDGAGWHTAGDLVVPDNMTLLPLPARAPELNPVENVWQFIRDNWLGDRVFASYEDILDHCCHAWNRLTDQPWKIMSIGLRQWARRC